MSDRIGSVTIMSIDPLIPTILGALLGSSLSYLVAVTHQRRTERRTVRSSIYTTHLPACLEEVANFVRRPYTEGPMAYMESSELSSLLKELYRQALLAAPRDEYRTRSLWAAAFHLDDVRRSCIHGDNIPRVREGGWAKLSYDIVVQIEKILLKYEIFLQKKLLPHRRRRRPRNYVRLEINRDKVDPDTSRFDAPDSLSCASLENLLGVKVISWRLRTSVPVYKCILDVWVHPEDAGEAVQRMMETNNRWLFPLVTSPDERWPQHQLICSALQNEDTTAPRERISDAQRKMSAMDTAVPDLVRDELEGRT